MAAEMVGDSLGGEAMAGGWGMVGDVAFGGEEVAEEVGGVAVADEGAGGFSMPRNRARCPVARRAGPGGVRVGASMLPGGGD